MKILLASLIILFVGHLTMAQGAGELVEWKTASTYRVDSLSISKEQIRLECLDCRIFEIKSASGVSGLFLMGNGNFEFLIDEVDVKDEFQTCLLRFNPSELRNYAELPNQYRVQDEGFHLVTIQVLKTAFSRSYHAGMNALIPPKAAFSAHFYTPKYGELIGSFTQDQELIRSLSKKRNYHIKGMGN